jgi:hypothetical protein
MPITNTISDPKILKKRNLDCPRGNEPNTLQAIYGAVHCSRMTELENKDALEHLMFLKKKIGW